MSPGRLRGGLWACCFLMSDAPETGPKCLRPDHFTGPTDGILDQGDAPAGLADPPGRSLHGRNRNSH